MVSGTLAPLYSFWVKVGLKRGSGPDRGRSPVEWGDFPFVLPSVRPFPPWLAGSEACLAGSKACLAGSWAIEGGNGWMDGWTDR